VGGGSFGDGVGGGDEGGTSEVPSRSKLLLVQPASAIAAATMPSDVCLRVKPRLSIGSRSYTIPDIVAPTRRMCVTRSRYRQFCPVKVKTVKTRENPLHNDAARRPVYGAVHG
jgi:hypothetical protein